MDLKRQVQELFEESPVPIIPTISISVNQSPHSFEFGPANARHKVYYSDIADLKAKISAALEAEAYFVSLKQMPPISLKETTAEAK